MTAATERRFRAYRFTLDPSDAQRAALVQHVGAARWAYNHAIAAKQEAYNKRELQLDELVTLGFTEQQARKQATIKLPIKGEIQKTWNRLKGDDTTNQPGICPWWRSVSTYAFQSAFADADQAYKNFFSSLSGNRAGARVGVPRFKKKGRSRDSVRLYGASLRLDGNRRLNLPRIGSVRMHDSGKRLHRAIQRGAVIQNVTLSRGAHRWYASVLVDEPAITAGRETQGGADGATLPGLSKRQKANGIVGVNLGVRHLATLSTGEHVDNPRHLQRAERKIKKLQRSIARSERGSNRLAKKKADLAKQHHLVAEQRGTTLHHLTKWLTTRFETVALQNVDVKTMTASARGTVDNPGRHVRQKAQLNRAVLDAAFGETRRQLEYKALWYGATVHLVDSYEPVDQTCCVCGTTRPKLPLSQRTFTCFCGLFLDRDINAARNLKQVVAQDSGDTLNACGDHVRPQLSGAAAAVDEAGSPGPGRATSGK